MPGRAGSRTPQAPRSGARGSRFCRALLIPARARALPALGKIGGNRASLGRSGAAWHDGKSGETDPGTHGAAASGEIEKGKAPPRQSAAGRRRLAIARLPQSDVGGAVFGRLFELDEAAANPVRPEFGGADLEVQVGLAARFRDLAPAGPDLVALSA
jgi:hypothetical protein